MLFCTCFSHLTVTYRYSKSIHVDLLHFNGCILFNRMDIPNISFCGTVKFLFVVFFFFPVLFQKSFKEYSQKMPSYNLCKFIYGISFRSGIVRSKGTLCTFLTCIVTLNFKKLYQFILPPTVFLRKLLLPTSLASYPVIPQVHTFNTILSNYLISATELTQGSTFQIRLTTRKSQILPNFKLH